MHRILALASLLLIIIGSACGGGEVSMTEYVDELNTIMGDANRQYEAMVADPQFHVLVAEGADLLRYDPQDLQAGLDEIGRLEQEVMELTAAIEPPEVLADLHRLLFDDRFTTAREALAARAAKVGTWDELSNSPEMAAYRTAVARDKEVCLEIQDELAATAERGVFADTPWVPGELKEVVDTVLGCSSFPENPEDMYRPPGS